MPDPGRRVHLSSHDLDTIRRHARERAPAECCGALIGLLTDRQPAAASSPTATGDAAAPASPGHEDDVHVARVLAAHNVAESRTRYEVAPEDIALAEAEAAEVGLEVVGWYHSHPSSPPVPSPTDLEAAWPWYTYLVVDARSGEARAWRLAEDRSGFVEDELRVGDEDRA